jgi:hypothetical protein
VVHKQLIKDKIAMHKDKDKDKDKTGSKFSADFQISSYRILLEAKTKRYLARGAERSNQ